MPETHFKFSNIMNKKLDLNKSHIRVCAPLFNCISSPQAQDGQNVNLFYFSDSMEIASLEGLTLCCPEINHSKQPLA